MMALRKVLYFSTLAVMLLFLAGCGAAAESPLEPAVETSTPPAAAPTSTQQPAATPMPEFEERLVEVEWPAALKLGESDIVRLALIPSEAGYIPEIEYAGHELQTSGEIVPYYPGYAAEAAARLDAAGLDIEPGGCQVRSLERNQPVVWRWSIYPRSAGQQRMSLVVTLRWIPLEEVTETRESILFQQGLEVNVWAPMGTTAKKARTMALTGLIVGGVLTLPLAQYSARKRLETRRGQRVRRMNPNNRLSVEPAPGIRLARDEERLLRCVFTRYERCMVEKRYISGYSGANTFLVQPIHSDGRKDAYSVVKMGSRAIIQKEYANYLSFVRRTLPPVTSRVLGPPIRTMGTELSALQYTFVGMPGEAPLSLREYALHRSGNVTARLMEEKLFSTFGPAWWKQRQPYSFQLQQEYDRLLPVHLELDISTAPSSPKVLASLDQIISTSRGEYVQLRNLVVEEVDALAETVTLRRVGPDNLVRIRCRNADSQHFHTGNTVSSVSGIVQHTRCSYLAETAVRIGLTTSLHDQWFLIGRKKMRSPLFRLQEFMGQTIQGTRSVIHGDLNLENVLIGPGELIWLIDFAETREGHSLFDFVRLEVELVTQFIAGSFHSKGFSVQDFLTFMDNTFNNLPAGEFEEEAAVLNAVRAMAMRCLYDPQIAHEYYAALVPAFLGVLKYTNLDEADCAPMPKQFAFAAAAYYLTQFSPESS